MSKLTQDAAYYEYSSAADPLGTGLISQVPFHVFPHTLHETGPTQMIPLDVSHLLNCPYPATSPALLGHFIHILPKESLTTDANATSHIFYVIRGQGESSVNKLTIPWQTGDFFVLPAGAKAHHVAETDSAFYYINDAPLLNYLGVIANKPQFEPTLYPAATSEAKLREVQLDPKSQKRNRVSILLANAAFPQTRTITHTLWSMFGVLSAGETQPAHRHQSVAIDFAADCQPGCYTLIGKSVDETGHIIDPVRMDWLPNSVFITPPGLWHSHHNESGAAAHVIPLQDAGLHTYLRSLDIRFTSRS